MQFLKEVSNSIKPQNTYEFISRIIALLEFMNLIGYCMGISNISKIDIISIRLIIIWWLLFVQIKRNNLK